MNRLTAAFGALVVLAALHPTCALAEVCDKVAGDGWQAEHGPINVVTWPWALRLTAVVLGSILMIRLFRSRALAWMAAAMAGGLAVIYDLSALTESDNEVTRAAVSEGCWSADASTSTLLTILTFAVLCAAYALIAGTRSLIR